MKDREQIMNDYYKNSTEDQLVEDINSVFSTPEGREVIFKLPDGKEIKAKSIDMNICYRSDD